MQFREQDIHLMTDGMGIVLYSPETNKNIPEGCNFFEEEYSKPEDVAKHIKKGDAVGFCSHRLRRDFRYREPTEFCN